MRARRVVAYARLPHFVPIVVVLAATAALAIVIGGRDLTAARLTTILLAMLGGQIAVGVANELVDLPTDRRTQPHKPLASGLVSMRGAVAMGAVGLLLMLIAGGALGPTELAVCTLGNGIGIAYSLWFKRTMLAWLPYLVALPLIPIWVAICLDRFQPALLLVGPTGAGAIVGAQLAQALPDIAADRTAGIDSLSTRLGERRAHLVAILAALLTTLVAVAAGLAMHPERRVVPVAAALATALLLGDLAARRRFPRGAVMAAFPCIAGSVALVGIATISTLFINP